MEDERVTLPEEEKEEEGQEAVVSLQALNGSVYNVTKGRREEKRSSDTIIK